MSETPASFEEKVCRFFASELPRKTLYIRANLLFCSSECTRGYFNPVVFSTLNNLACAFKSLSNISEKREQFLRDKASMTMMLIAIDEKPDCENDELSLHMAFIFATAMAKNVLLPWIDAISIHMASDNDTADDDRERTQIEINESSLMVWRFMFGSQFQTQEILNITRDETLVDFSKTVVPKEFIIPEFDIIDLIILNMSSPEPSDDDDDSYAETTDRESEESESDEASELEDGEISERDSDAAGISAKRFRSK